MLAKMFFTGSDDDDDDFAPPGSPKDRIRRGLPALSTQLIFAGLVGMTAFLLFCYLRDRYTSLFAARTKLHGYAPHDANDRTSFFGWILPTLRTNEYTVLQIVGLDAVVLLNYFKMAIYLFGTLSVVALVLVYPVHVRAGGDPWDGSDPPEKHNDSAEALLWILGVFMARDRILTPLVYDDQGNSSDPKPPKLPNPADGLTWLELIFSVNGYLIANLCFVYFFVCITLLFIRRYYKRFLAARHIFSLDLHASVPARTTLVRQIPKHLRSEKALSDYFGDLGLKVETIAVVKNVTEIRRLLKQRTDMLVALEQAWTRYLGNPCEIDAYRPRKDGESRQVLEEDAGLSDGFASRDRRDSAAGDGNDNANHEEEGQSFLKSLQNADLNKLGRTRPKVRPRWWSLQQTDAIEYYTTQFEYFDAEVKEAREKNLEDYESTAFVTFTTMADAQNAAQILHYPRPFAMVTSLAPEPRDIYWANVPITLTSLYIRECIVLLAMGLLFLLWAPIVTVLGFLLNPEVIDKALPGFLDILEKEPRLAALVSNTLPTLALVMFNSMLPWLLEALSRFQGLQARSWIEASLLKKYFSYLFVSVIVIFVGTITTLLYDLQDWTELPKRIATRLGKADNFFVSYVVLQGVALWPLQLLQLPQVLSQGFFHIWCRTPRDFAENSAPPMINYGTVYPQSILIFIICLTYSVSKPIILPFGMIYFATGYLVLKYQLLFVYYKPYESHGQAWPITFRRLIWGLMIFITFMVGLFTIKRAFILSVLLLPAYGIVGIYIFFIRTAYNPHEKFIPLASVVEVTKASDDNADTASVHAEPVPAEQSDLHRRRYSATDISHYFCVKSPYTDYSQPPMSYHYYGVLDTGQKRYDHPSISGALPWLWLPQKVGDDNDITEQCAASHATLSRPEQRDNDMSTSPDGKANNSGFEIPGASKVDNSKSAPTDLLSAENEIMNLGSSGRRSTSTAHADRPHSPDCQLDKNPWDSQGAK